MCRLSWCRRNCRRARVNDKGEMINALIDAIETQYAIDPQRVYLTGFSLGGFGTWALGLNSSDRFAALVPVAGGWEFGGDGVPVEYL